MHTKSPNPANKQSQQYKKLLCAYHTTEYLTNFCVDQKCLMPLCPSCIVDHTQQHYSQKSKPLYMNLHQALNNVKQSCLANIHQFQQLKNFTSKFSKAQQFKPKMIQQVHYQLYKHKQNIYVYIQRLFIQYQKQLYKKIMKQYQQQGLYNLPDIKQSQNKIQQTLSELNKKIQMLKNQQCLITLITYYGEQRQKIAEIKQECQKNVKKFNNFNIETNFNQGMMKKQLQKLFQNCITISKNGAKQQILKYFKVQPKTPQKSNAGSISQSQSRISKNLEHSGVKTNIQNPKSPMQASVKRQKQNTRYQSAFR